jgi:CheY-like chemotaxis protein
MEKTETTATSTRIIAEDDALPRILVVDDDPAIRDMLTDILGGKGFTVDLSPGSGDALEKLIDYKYNLLLLDANLPGISGFELLKYCKKNHPLMEIIMITGNPELDQAVSTVKDGAFDYIAKPFSVEKLLLRVEAALKHRKEVMLKSLSDADGAQGSAPGMINMPLPDYKIIRTLGSGTMGVVLLVERERRHFALKILRKNQGDKTAETRSKRFLREAKILSQIEHPNVVRVYDSGFPENSVPFILMEYVPGTSLVELIKDNKLSVSQKLYIISQIASALSAVHKFGILHRDIKPGNVLVKDDLTAKLSDFGVARVSDSSITMTHEILGSPAYMNPEAFTSNKPVDNRSDIFSLGILSYELVTGKKPFQGETVNQMMNAIQKSRPVEPRKIVPELPVKVQNILARMLRKVPDERFQDASDIVLTINNLNKSPEDAADIEKGGFIKTILGGPAKVWS